MKYIFYLLPALAGLTITTQAGVNSQLRFAINNPWIAAFISFLVGTVFLGSVIIFSRQPIPSAAALKSVELYKYTGGLLGAFFVTVIIFSVPRIGSANVFALVIAGQFIVALFYDHFGLFGFPQSSISWIKLLGVVLLIAGAYLVVKK
ncbi:MAG: DMT family transporter [Bacteroidota bacterium]